jgi:hypothetical protein
LHRIRSRVFDEFETVSAHGIGPLQRFAGSMRCNLLL